MVFRPLAPDIRRRLLPSRKSYGEDRLVEHEAVAPGHGVITLQTQELTPSQITLLAAAYKSTCDFAEQAGANSGLVETCRKEASQLESYLQTQPYREQEEEQERKEIKDQT